TIMINVGGALIPILVSAYLLIRFPEAIPRTIVAVAIVSYAVHRIARAVPGVGVVVPALWPPVITAATVLILAAVTDAPAAARFSAAYISGTIGSLIGADLLNLGRIKALGTATASIGGAGTFDGIFLSGILAVILV